MATNKQAVSTLKGSTREAISGYMFILPWLVGFLFLMGGPILFSLGLSFAEWDGISGVGNIQFKGLANFQEMASDERFHKAIWNTFIYMAGSVPLTMIGAVLVALLMNQKLKSIAFFRTVFYLPSVTAGVASSLLWFFIFQPEFGLLNYSIREVGSLINTLVNSISPVALDLSLQGPHWLSDPAWVKSAYIIMSLWGIGSGMIIYLAGLQGIPEQLYEAADIDGASTWQQFLNVTLPMLSPIIFFNLILTVIASFQVFTQAFVLSAGTGQPADAALFYVLYIYQVAFSFHKMGYASALAWVLFVMILMATMIQFRFAGWVYYEGELKK